jgi:hypothetical protein
MSASTQLQQSVRAAFSALIDYAGLFPPAALPFAQAREEYRAAQAGPYAWMLGRFILPARALRDCGADFRGPFSVIADGGLQTLKAVAAQRDAGTSIEALEIALPKEPEALGVLDGDIAGAALHDLPTFVELPRSERWSELLPETMSALARMGLHAKLRCGGLISEAFPTVEEVAEFISVASRAGVAFKATAGLHHPVRARDPASGFVMHGFLNLLTAAALASRADVTTLGRIVAEEDPAAFRFDDDGMAWRDRHIAVAELSATRRGAFVAYGSCSFSEPVEDLCALNVLPPQ